MTIDPVTRVLDPEPVGSLADYRQRGGGRGWTRAVTADPLGIVELIDESGLRGRGGAGFPTAAKWRAVRKHASSTDLQPTVVVNAAEGEPGSFKDRLLLRRNPYKVLEGALIAAVAVGSDRVVVATKASFGEEIDRLRRAIDELSSDHVGDQVEEIVLVPGPDAYLFGEETGLLEVVAGREPFPRIAPPWRQGLEDGSGAPATERMASLGPDTSAPPSLVNNVETLAHVADIAAHGVDWFAEMGLDGQPGTMLCTVTGDTRHAGVAEVAVGTTIAEVLDRAGGGSLGDPLAVLPGVSHPLIRSGRFDAPLAYGSGEHVHVGSGALRFFAEGTDPVAVAAGAARFLAMESCGQCTPCKTDGLALHEALSSLGANDAPEGHLEIVADLTNSVTVGARCGLAGQIADIVAGLLVDFPEEAAAHLGGLLAPADPVPVVPLLDIEDGVALHQDDHLTIRPDWSHDEIWDGSYPAPGAADPASQ